MDIGELCTREVVTAQASEPLLEAAKRMRDQHVGSLIVVDGHTSRLHPIGVVTDRDIVIQVLAKAPEEVQRLEVGDVMTREVVSVRPDEGVEEAVSQMRRHGVRRRGSRLDTLFTG